jgi:hypothetical protein
MIKDQSKSREKLEGLKDWMRYAKEAFENKKFYDWAGLGRNGGWLCCGSLGRVSGNVVL